MKLQGSCAVVTGGTRGLGAVVARALAAEGATVLAAAREAPAESDGPPDGVLTVSADVTRPESLAALMRTAHERFGGPHIVVANAGVSRPGPVAALSAEHWHEVLETNLTGVLNTVQAALPYLAQGGRIITLSSLLGRRPMAGAAAYCASKAAVEMLTRVCAVELAPRGITVNCLAPGFVDSGMGRQLIGNEALWAGLRDTIPVGRPGTEAEVAHAALFLASEESAYITGHVLNIDGGSTL
ncbi:3-oxoacyl-[acyl-carrier protein] reductase [Kitasatospora sp. MAA4]|uniref:SDR family NAD(P)-dependent oxidoreductase n=1 Tax=Kitasatospora sp. MAA4 TaxID=3035093 RepID=UPI002476FFAA|nr:SDR family NAD(P)-dependent oxidoreductase [Kitasatospora sp. MAA4]MDH6132396.1 3-oxoacyl-[acyl-carrier protein] reductase [Kitasatospora sp. MAA4]